MTSQKKFYQDSSLFEFSTELLEIRPVEQGLAAILAETIFYPEGGGQDSDGGTINGVPLTGVYETESEILHVLDSSGAASLKPGPVRLILDAEQRREQSLLHSVQHLLAAVILHLYSYPTVSMHLGSDTCSIDVECPDPSNLNAAHIEEELYRMVQADLPILSHFCPPEKAEAFSLRRPLPETQEQIRIIEIKDYDYTPCCGVHRSSTGSLGSVLILSMEKHRGMTRILFCAGKQALRHCRKLHNAATAVSGILKVPPMEIHHAAASLSDKYLMQEKSLLLVKEQNAQYEADRIVSGQTNNPVIKTYNDKSMDEVLRIGRAAQKMSPAVFVMVSGAERKLAVLCSRRDLDLRPVLKSALEAYNGNGGGGPSFFQASFTDKRSMEDFVAVTGAALGTL